jgi:hypothetical protein
MSGKFVFCPGSAEGKTHERVLMGAARLTIARPGHWAIALNGKFAFPYVPADSCYNQSWLIAEGY